MQHRPTISCRRGFTLVELLVVIGIIVVLIGILMPSLRRAREAANITMCLSNLRQIGLASAMHANDHKGYYPFAGYINTGTGPLDITPAQLNDSNQQKYSYYNGSGTIHPLPYMGAVAPYLGYSLNVDNESVLFDQLLDPNGVRKIFTCPSQQQPQNTGSMIGVQGIHGLSGGWTQRGTYSSYAVNEGFLGWPYDSCLRFRGQCSQIRQPSEVILMGDGLPSGPQMWWTYYSNTVSLADAFLDDGRAGRSTQFDLHRHDLRMNVLYIDGHAATIQITQDGTHPSGDLSQTLLEQAER